MGRFVERPQLQVLDCMFDCGTASRKATQRVGRAFSPPDKLIRRTNGFNGSRQGDRHVSPVRPSLTKGNVGLPQRAIG